MFNIVNFLFEKLFNMLESFEPIETSNSRVLILGTMPGKASLEAGQYYAFNRNKFWQILAELLGFDHNLGYAAKCRKISEKGVAVWDVLGKCVRKGSLDSNITEEMPNDLREFIYEHKQLRAVFFNGSNAEKFFKKYIKRQDELFTEIYFETLPSTSPANASQSYLEKLERWRKIADFLN